MSKIFPEFRYRFAFLDSGFYDLALPRQSVQGIGCFFADRRISAANP